MRSRQKSKRKKSNSISVGVVQPCVAFVWSGMVRSGAIMGCARRSHQVDRAAYGEGDRTLTLSREFAKKLQTEAQKARNSCYNRRKLKPVATSELTRASRSQITKAYKYASKSILRALRPAKARMERSSSAGILPFAEELGADPRCTHTFPAATAVNTRKLVSVTSAALPAAQTYVHRFFPLR